MMAPNAATVPTPTLPIRRPATVSETSTTTIGPGERHSPAAAGPSLQIVVRNITLPSSIAANAAEKISSARQLDHIGRTRTAARSSAGTGWRADRQIATAMAVTATTAAPISFTALAPGLGTSISAQTNAPTPTTTHSAPNRSGTPVPAVVVFTSTIGPTARASSPNGTLTKKIQRQENSTNNPPTGGPRAAAMAPTADQVLTALARRDAGTAASSRASELGISIAAPTA